MKRLPKTLPARGRLNSRVPMKRQKTRSTRTRAARSLANDVLPASINQSVSPDHKIARAASRKVRRELIDQNIPEGLRRPIICDGESLAFDDINQRFDAARIAAAVSWFETAGHPAVAVVPSDFYHKAQNEYALDNLANSGKLVVAKAAGGSAEHNFPFESEMLAKAVAENAAVISEREFRECYYSNGDFQTIISGRVIGFCFFKTMIFIPVDPYGRKGPLLKDILRK